MTTDEQNTGTDNSSVWPELFEDWPSQLAEIKHAADPLSLLEGTGLTVEEIIRKYSLILQTLPDRQFELALRDLYWAAVLEQVRSGGKRNIEAEEALLFESDLSGLILKKVNLARAEVQYANLINTSLQDSTLTGSQLQGANLNGAVLSGARLVRANLQDCQMIRAKLIKANLSGADFEGAKLRYADLRGAKCTGTNFSFADMTYANLDGADLKNVEFNSLTIWPEKYKRQPDQRSRSLEGPKAASFEELKVLLEAQVRRHVARISDADIERAAVYVLRKIIEAETGLEYRAGELWTLERRDPHRNSFVLRFIRKSQPDRLVHYDPDLRRYLEYQRLDVSPNQASHIINVVARAVSEYEIHVIPKEPPPSSSKRKSKWNSRRAEDTID